MAALEQKAETHMESCLRLLAGFSEAQEASDEGTIDGSMPVRRVDADLDAVAQDLAGYLAGPPVEIWDYALKCWRSGRREAITAGDISSAARQQCSGTEPLTGRDPA